MAEVDSNRGPSAYQSNALPLGQTGSRSVSSNMLVFFVPCDYVTNAVQIHRNVLRVTMTKLIPSEPKSSDSNQVFCTSFRVRCIHFVGR